MAIDTLGMNNIAYCQHWIDEYTFKLFGSRIDIIQNEMRKLLTANNSSELFMPTDLHFRILDRVIDCYCDIYNDEAEINDNLIFVKDQAIEHLYIDSIRTMFFWDADYELFNTPVISKDFTPTLNALGVSRSGINIQQSMMADLSDFALEKYSDDPDWNELEDDFWFEQ